MSRWLRAIVAIALLSGLPTQASEPTNDEVLREYNQRRITIERRAMSVLVGWSTMSVGTGAVGLAIADHSTWRAAHGTNLAWGVVNLAIGIPALVGAVHDRPERYGAVETVQRDRRLTRLFLINAGLDLLYVTGGAFANHIGHRRADPVLQAVGWSIIVQGSFLLAFDATLATLIASPRKVDAWPLFLNEGAGLGVSVVWGPTTASR